MSLAIKPSPWVDCWTVGGSWMGAASWADRDSCSGAPLDGWVEVGSAIATDF